MNEFAQKLMLRNDGSQSYVPTAIFGTVSTLSQYVNRRHRYRIGLWPIVCETDPAFAMGVATVLGYLLEQWESVVVYRLFVKLDDERDSFTWNIGQSQFAVDGWHLDELDNDISIGGTLRRADGAWDLSIQIESDEAQRESKTHFISERFGHAQALLEKLPEVARNIAKALGIDRISTASAFYKIKQWNKDQLEVALNHVFNIEVGLLLALWDDRLHEVDVLSLIDTLTEICRQSNDEFGNWLVGHGIARMASPVFTPIDEAIVSVAGSVLEIFSASPIPSVFIASALYQVGHSDEAYELLEDNLGLHNTDPISFLALGELYLQGHRLADAIEVYLSAIVGGIVNARLYSDYGHVLQLLDYNQEVIDQFVLVSPDEVGEDIILWEAIEAYEHAQMLDLNDIKILHAQLMLLTDFEDERFWRHFERLVAIDSTGNLLRNLVENLSDFEDLGPAVKVLSRATSQSPDRFDLYLMLAYCQMFAGDDEAAKVALHKAQQLTDNHNARIEMERLTLSIGDRGFEYRFGQLADMVSAGHTLDADNVRYLENVLQKAPLFSDGYLILAKMYHLLKLNSQALDILLDGYSHLPDDPEIVDLMCQLLWDSGEKKLAFDYLNKAMKVNPSHVPLLARIGLFLYQDGQFDLSRGYLARAEAINPRNPTLRVVQKEIVRMMTE